MGTINYRTSDYITMGVYPQSVWDYEDDKAEIIEEMLMNGYRNIKNDEYESYLLDRIYEDEEEDYCNAERVLAEYTNCLEFFTVSIEEGYYQGFSIKIEYDGYEFDDIEDKRRAKEEAEIVGKCLEELAEMGMVACFPSWGTSYADYNRTLELIADAVKAMKEDVRMTNVDRYAWEV